MILQRMRNHYCDTLTFREQRNLVENMKQGVQESAAQTFWFMSRVLWEASPRDFKGAVPQEEFDTLLYDVSFNGVKEDVRHVLDSVMARHGELDVDKMYDAVKTHEVYMARNQCSQPQVWLHHDFLLINSHSSLSYTSRRPFQTEIPMAYCTSCSGCGRSGTEP